MTNNDSFITLELPGGRIAYDVAGTGPLVILVPGMGDLRSTYRFLVPRLQDARWRAVSVDLRGHGDSDATFASYGDVETANDVVALIERLGGPAVLVGNSMGAAATVLAAAERPDLVAGLVLLGPFLRDPELRWAKRLLFRWALACPWARVAWKSYLPRLYAGRRPEDFKAYRERIVSSLRRPGHTAAFARTSRTSHAVVEARLAEVVGLPVLVIMGEQDPDFPSPRAEAEWIGQALAAEVVLVPDAGHYPQSQRPDVVAEAIENFLARLSPHA